MPNPFRLRVLAAAVASIVFAACSGADGAEVANGDPGSEAATASDDASAPTAPTATSTGTAATPPASPTSTSTPPPPPDGGGSSPDGGASSPPPPDGGGASSPPPDGGGSSPPPPDGGGSSPPPPDGGGSSPPPPDGGGSSPPPPDGGGSPPPPDGGGSSPPPDGGGSPPPPDGGADAGAGTDAGTDAGADAGTDAGSCSVGSTPPTGSGQAETRFAASTAWLAGFTGELTGISGGTAAVGYQGVYGSVAGSVTIYAWDGCNAKWTEQQTVTGSDTSAYDFFGSSLNLSGDSLFVGANYKSPPIGSTSGAAYVFTRSNGTWTQLQSLTAPSGAQARFGWALAQSGSTAAVSAPLGKDPSSVVTYTGAVAIYTKGLNGMWSSKAVVVPASAETNDVFGYSLALDSGTLVAGAPGALTWGSSTSSKGKAWVFTGSSSTWTQTAALTASDGAANDWFGRSVARSGNTIVVGAPNNGGVGAAYVFTYANGAWSQTAKLVASDGAANDHFGYTVATVSETRVLVGAIGANKIYSFTYANGAWGQDASVYSVCSGNAGYSLSVSGNLAITSKPGGNVIDLADPTTTCVGP